MSELKALLGIYRAAKIVCEWQWEHVTGKAKMDMLAMEDAIKSYELEKDAANPVSPSKKEV